jgi:hypothetical protein
MPALRRAFPIEKPVPAEKSRRGPIPGSARPDLATLVSLWDLMGCHEFRAWNSSWISSVKWGLGRPQTGSALHPLVTAVSVKKSLTGCARIQPSISQNYPLHSSGGAQ